MQRAFCRASFKEIGSWAMRDLLLVIFRYTEVHLFISVLCTIMYYVRSLCIYVLRNDRLR